jgi:hypothetical protein
MSSGVLGRHFAGDVSVKSRDQAECDGEPAHAQYPGLAPCRLPGVSDGTAGASLDRRTASPAARGSNPPAISLPLGSRIPRRSAVR